MSDALVQRVRAAAAAGWKTVIFFWALMVASWIGVLVILHYRPGFVQTLIGGGSIDWDDLQMLYLEYFAVLKMILLALLIAVVWLSFWGRKLGKLGG